jgi:methylmalonyl-CoA mutase
MLNTLRTGSLTALGASQKEWAGRVAKTIETGLPKMRIEEAAARKQARIDSGQDTIVGVNKYITDEDAGIDILEVDNTAVRSAQIERLRKLKKARNPDAVRAALDALTKCAETGEGNLLELSVEAARKRATLGEISYACEKVFGRYKAVIRTISGVYSGEMSEDTGFRKQGLRTSSAARGRRPGWLRRWAGRPTGRQIIAASFADMGFDVDIGALFQTPLEAARQAVENDVHIVGISSLAAGHKTLVPELIKELKDMGRGDIMVVIGGVIPKQDYEFLYSAGVTAVFGPGTVISKAAQEILKILIGNVRGKA